MIPRAAKDGAGKYQKYITGLVCFFWFLSLGAQEVRFVRSIELKSSGGKKGLTSLIFGRKEQMMVKPASFCQLGDGRVAVTDAVNGVVALLDADGTVKKIISRIKGGRLVTPVGCCVDGAGYFYVSDSARRMVLQFDQKFKYKKIFINHPDSRITGIAFDHFGKSDKGVFYCVDTEGHRVLCFSGDGGLKFSFGQRGSGEGQFNFPTHITLDRQYIYITDALNFRVQVFDRAGTFVGAIGKRGQGGGEFSKPKGLAVDQKQRIYVADAMFDNVQIFSPRGEFLYYFGGPGRDNGQFWMPSDVMVTGDQRIWVADTYNNRIQVFKLVAKESSS